MEAIKSAWKWLKWVLGFVGILILAILFIPKAVGRKAAAQKKMDLLRVKKMETIDRHNEALKAVDAENSKAVAVIINKRDKKLIAVDAEIEVIRSEAKKGPVELAAEWTEFLKERSNG